LVDDIENKRGEFDMVVREKGKVTRVTGHFRSENVTLVEKEKTGKTNKARQEGEKVRAIAKL